jgi:hypothetical protein
MELLPIFVTTTPTEWLPAPEWMNVHYFLRAERCPRSAALRYARYTSLWNRNGYPDKPSIAAAAGTVVHITVAKIATSLARAGCTSVSDPRFCGILKTLGGYSTVIGNAITFLVTGLADNPRFQPISESFAASLQKRIPHLRENVQLQLTRLEWAAHSPAAPTAANDSAKSKVRYPLTPGSHFEVELRDPTLKWKGVADLVELDGSSCAITDFKNGAASDDHLFQLRIYALLWLRDPELNPHATPVGKLTVSYPTENRDGAFSQPDQSSLRSALQSRTQAVREAITGPTSKPILSGDVCPHCDVRQLCSEYWSVARPTVQAPTSLHNRFDDVELVLTTKKGESTWLADARIASHLKVPAEVLLRWSSDQFRILESLMPGSKVRLVGVLLSDPQDESPVVTCLANTDLIVLEQ